LLNQSGKNTRRYLPLGFYWQSLTDLEGDKVSPKLIPKLLF